ncbi:hypothetical protein GXP67_01000 [Rhodocytophaga rosea]|uniref:Uncharacterized protein n=1 Tax=Rhodocytophaga rosea TaxID=2704465 RepID=A0A6C0GCE8_9BACT|nr:hypothetical protein [Rhodocytophaga rosea]QHT65350.1 hypothetical protein GXP67_01000 [Rhodocytophaga rosea]
MDIVKQIFTSIATIDPLPLPGRTAKAIALRKNNSIINISDEYQIEGFYIRCIKK